MKKYIYKHDRLKMTSLSIVFDAGANSEMKGKKGTMHLMEHLICKTFKDLYDRLARNGIDWNAYTSDSNIVVWFSGLSSKLTKDLKLELISRITNSIEKYVSEDVFEKERNVVLQEYMDCVFDNTEGNYLNIFRHYYDYWLPIGKESDIRAFNYDDMLKTYDAYFRNPVRIVEIGPEKTVEFETMFENTPIHKHCEYKFGEYDTELVKTDNTVKTPVYLLFKKLVKSSDYPCFVIGLKMLVDGLESPYYVTLREKHGLTYYVSCGVSKNMNNCIAHITACTDTENSDKLLSMLEDLSAKTEELLTQDRFDTVMNSIKVNREKEKILKYMSSGKYTDITKLRLPENLDKIDLDKIRYIMSRYFADIVIVKGL